MSGKCRPSLRDKTLYNVERCDLSQTDKDCIKAVFDKFEEQQAEIERLKENNRVLKYCNEANILSNAELRDRLRTAKTEAVKEFANRLKEKATTEFWSGFEIKELSSPFVTVKKIDNLVKEMVGEEE